MWANFTLSTSLYTHTLSPSGALVLLYTHQRPKEAIFVHTSSLGVQSGVQKTHTWTDLNNTTSPRSKRFISCYHHKPEQRPLFLQLSEQQSAGTPHGAFLSKHNPCGAGVFSPGVGDGVVGPGGVVGPFSFGRQVLVEGFPPEQSPEQHSSPLRHPSPSFCKLHSTGGGVGLRLGVLDGLEVIGSSRVSYQFRYLLATKKQTTLWSV